jgi:hypothetical protein
VSYELDDDKWYVEEDLEGNCYVIFQSTILALLKILRETTKNLKIANW